ncbi:hypothetical protein TYRP_003826 [Tyrophagus putrescentiae]|nr:hypothetical protein TYRP_003826 [Tyrophagus putrescentiae]
MTAGKRPLEAVHSCLVGGQVRFGGKGAGAGGAGERSLSGVQPLVNLKAGGAAEGHRTAGTGEARQVEAPVRLQVQLQRRRVGKAPVADAADEPFEPGQNNKSKNSEEVACLHYYYPGTPFHSFSSELKCAKGWPRKVNSTCSVSPRPRAAAAAAAACSPVSPRQSSLPQAWRCAVAAVVLVEVNVQRAQRGEAVLQTEELHNVDVGAGGVHQREVANGGGHGKTTTTTTTTGGRPQCRVRRVLVTANGEVLQVGERKQGLVEAGKVGGVRFAGRHHLADCQLHLLQARHLRKGAQQAAYGVSVGGADGGVV